MKKTVLSGIVCISLGTLLAACSTPVDLDAPRSSNSGGSGMTSSLFAYSEHRCDADPAQTLVGKTFSERLEKQARSLSGSKVVRTLRPGQVITMEYDPERINLRLDDGDVITSVGCG